MPTTRSMRPAGRRAGWMVGEESEVRFARGWGRLFDAPKGTPSDAAPAPVAKPRGDRDRR